MPDYRLHAVRDWSKASDYLVVTPSILAKSMFYFVQEIGHFYSLANYCTERENLNSFLVVYTIKGRGYLRYRNKEYVLRPRDVFFIDCVDYQFYETDRSDLWELSWVHFYGASSRGYFDQFMDGGDPVITLSEQQSSVPRILESLLEVNKKKDVRTEPLSSKLIVDLLTELLFARWQRNQDPAPSFAFLPEVIARAVDFIEKRFHEKITLDRLAHELLLSASHLSHEFKKNIGMTPNEYLINTRITAAKQLLTQTNEPVAAVADKVGIQNVSHFINLFKQREEMTPLSFRKKWRSRNK
jgi:AraC-like DNA-binding protein